MKKFAVVLFVIVVSAGSGQARTSGMSSLSHAHFSACSDVSPTDLRMPPRGRRLRPSSALSIRIVLPHLRRRVPAVAKFEVSQW